jgi:retinol dehydrogenase-12
MVGGEGECEYVEPVSEIHSNIPKHQQVTTITRYNLSKLLQVYVIRHLATLVFPITSTNNSSSKSKLESAFPITINCLDPCFCKTDLGRGAGGALKVAGKIFEFLFARTAEEGSRCVVIASGAGRESHGGYMRAGKLKEYAPKYLESEKEGYGDYVWEQVTKKLEAIEPGILAGVVA